ncbi:MAG: hypothetical protein ABI384_06855 [Allobranchiibius sp.]
MNDSPDATTSPAPATGEQSETTVEQDQSEHIRGADNVSNTPGPDAKSEPAPAGTPAADAPATGGADDWATPPPPLDDTAPAKAAEPPAPEPAAKSASVRQPVPAVEPDIAEQREDTDDDQAAARIEERDAASEGDTTDDDGPLGPGSAEPGDDGSGPAGWVKGDDNDMSFHSSDSPGFDDAEASVWFKDESTARNAGFRHWDPSKR